MFGEIKKMLGIEDARISIKVPEKIRKKDGSVKGTIVLTSMTNSEVTEINIKLIEKYFRGRGESKLIDEYTIGEINLDRVIEIKKNDIVEIPFDLPYRLFESEIDKLENKNFIFSGIAGLAKSVKGVKSEFRVEAMAYVKGTKLNPHHSVRIQIR